MSSFLAMVTDLGSGSKGLVLVEPMAAGALPGQGLPEAPVYPGHGLPDQPVDPGYGGGVGGGGHPGNRPPIFPGRPGNDLPNFPGRPGNALPPLPPDMAHPGHPLPLPPQIDNGLPIYPARPDHELPPPGTIYPPLPPGANVPQGKALALIAISGVGYRWTVIDTSLSAGMPLPTTPPPYPTGGPVPPTVTPT